MCYAPRDESSPLKKIVMPSLKMDSAPEENNSEHASDLIDIYISIITKNSTPEKMKWLKMVRFSIV